METQDALRPWNEKALAALDAGQFESALDALVQGYQQEILAYCILSMRDRASGEDVAQEVFIAIWQALPGFRRDASLRTWMFAIARNTCMKRIGIIGRLRRIFICGIDKTVTEAQPDHSDSPEEIVIKKQRVERLLPALGKLRKKERALIIMRHIEGLSLDDIAERYSVARETVRQQLLQAQQRLQHLMD